MILAAVLAATLILPPHSASGAVNPKITPANMRENICKKGWSTKSIRPPASYTDKLKVKQIAAAHLGGKPSDYEEDHLISLELGGHPTSPRNLWPELYAGRCGARVKDRLEDRLHTLVCKGKVPLRTAQHAIASNWVKAYVRYLGPIACGK